MGIQVLNKLFRRAKMRTKLLILLAIIIVVTPFGAFAGEKWGISIGSSQGAYGHNPNYYSSYLPYGIYSQYVYNYRPYILYCSPFVKHSLS